MCKVQQLGKFFKSLLMLKYPNFPNSQNSILWQVIVKFEQFWFKNPFLQRKTDSLHSGILITGRHSGGTPKSITKFQTSEGDVSRMRGTRVIQMAHHKVGPLRLADRSLLFLILYFEIKAVQWIMAVQPAHIIDLKQCRGLFGAYFPAEHEDCTKWERKKERERRRYQKWRVN